VRAPRAIDGFRHDGLEANRTERLRFALVPERR
jgi:hypothetical protein